MCWDKRCSNHSQNRSHSPPLTLTTILQPPLSPHHNHHSTFKFKLTETHTTFSKPRIEFRYTQTQTIRRRTRTRTHPKMATLQKFKLLAMQCGVAQSPTRSPRTSPLVQLRRRKTTLRMLLRRSPRRRDPPLPREQRRLLGSSEKKGRDLVRRHSLKDLFVSSPPGEEETSVVEIHSVANPGLPGSVTGPGSPRPAWTGFRCRSLLSRKAWRPVLLTISE